MQIKDIIKIQDISVINFRYPSWNSQLIFNTKMGKSDDEKC